MTKAKAPRHLAGAHEIARGQLVDRVEGVPVVNTRGGHGQVEFERIPGHGRGLGEAASGSAEPVQLGHDRRHHGRGDLAFSASAVVPTSPARQLQEVERVAPAGPVKQLELGGARGVDELTSGRGRQGAELHTAHRATVDAGRRDGCLEPTVGLARAKRPRHQHRRLRRAAQQMGDELDGGAVGPVQVLEHEHQGLRSGQALDQVAHCVVSSEALGRGGGAGSGPLERAQGREHAGDLRHVLRGQAAEGSRLERCEVLVERIDDQPEGQLLLELRRAAP